MKEGDAGNVREVPGSKSQGLFKPYQTMNLILSDQFSFKSCKQLLRGCEITRFKFVKYTGCCVDKSLYGNVWKKEDCQGGYCYGLGESLQWFEPERQ